MAAECKRLFCRGIKVFKKPFFLAESLHKISGFFLTVPVEEQGASIKTASANFCGLYLLASCIINSVFRLSLLRFFFKSFKFNFVP